MESFQWFWVQDSNEVFCFLWSLEFYSPIDFVDFFFILWVYSSMTFPRRRRRHIEDSIFIAPWFFLTEVWSAELFIQNFTLVGRMIRSTKGFCGHRFALRSGFEFALLQIFNRWRLYIRLEKLKKGGKALLFRLSSTWGRGSLIWFQSFNVWSKMAALVSARYPLCILSSLKFQYRAPEINIRIPLDLTKQYCYVDQLIFLTLFWTSLKVKFFS